MAASDSCVPNLYADALEPRANRRDALYDDTIRSVGRSARPAADFLCAALCTFFFYALLPVTVLSLRQRMIASIVVGIVTVISHSQRQDSLICNLVQVRATESVLRSAVVSQFFLFCVNLLLGLHLPVWAYALSLFAMASSMMLMSGFITRSLRRIHSAGYGADHVVLYGHPDTTQQVASTILRSPTCGLHPIAIIHDDSFYAASHIFRSNDGLCESIPVSTGPLTSAKLNSLKCDLLMLTAPHLSQEELATTAELARECGASVAVLSPAMGREEALEKIEVDTLDLETEVRAVSAWQAGFLKRSMDFIIAVFLLILGSPIFLLIAICIKLDSRGPVLFVQKRVGRNGELFDIFKFRSMHADSPMYEASPTEPTDPRITRVGRILRRTGLDETAQLLNVLLGQMSLVGPRPEMPFLVERYIRAHRPRLQATPGITGLWQLSTDRAFPIHQNIHYDLFYIRNRTCFLDVAILLHTLLFAMRGGV